MPSPAEAHILAGSQLGDKCRLALIECENFLLAQVGGAARKTSLTRKSCLAPEDAALTDSLREEIKPFKHCSLILQLTAWPLDRYKRTHSLLVSCLSSAAGLPSPASLPHNRPARRAGETRLAVRQMGNTS